MSVVRGRPPGLAGGISGATSRYCSSFSACPAPKSPTSARSSGVHMATSREEKPPGSPSPRLRCRRQADQRTLSKRAVREWAAENGLDGAFDDVRHRHVTE